MSSLVRRIERVTKPSRPYGVGKFGQPLTSQPRGKGHMGRGEKVGTHNPKAKDLVARMKREARRKSNGSN